MNKFPNGNWENTKEVEIYLDMDPDDVSPEFLEKAKRWAAEGMVFCFASKAFTIFPRSRWTGSENTTDEFGGLELCHGLLSATYPRWAELQGTKARVFARPQPA
eukprot:8110484-Heterocapsa_arctica.AAC.1